VKPELEVAELVAELSDPEEVFDAVELTVTVAEEEPDVAVVAAVPVPVAVPEEPDLVELALPDEVALEDENEEESEDVPFEILMLSQLPVSSP